MIKEAAFTIYPVQDLAPTHRFHEKDLSLTVTKLFERQ